MSYESKPFETISSATKSVDATTVAANIALVKRWFQEVWNENDISSVRELFAADGIARGTGNAGSDIHGPDEFIAFAGQIRAAFPDITVTVDDAFGSGDKVAASWTAVMTHRGDNLGVPATNNKVRVSGTTIARVAGGQIVEGWDNWDQLGMLVQIGAYAPPSATDLAKTA